MKKKIYKITALLLATALMVMGCGSAKSGKENSDEDEFIGSDILR